MPLEVQDLVALINALGDVDPTLRKVWTDVDKVARYVHVRLTRANEFPEHEDPDTRRRLKAYSREFADALDQYWFWYDRVKLMYAGRSYPDLRAYKDGWLMLAAAVDHFNRRMCLADFP